MPALRGRNQVVGAAAAGDENAAVGQYRCGKIGSGRFMGPAGVQASATGSSLAHPTSTLSDTSRVDDCWSLIADHGPDRLQLMSTLPRWPYVLDGLFRWWADTEEKCEPGILVQGTLTAKVDEPADGYDTTERSAPTVHRT